MATQRSDETIRKFLREIGRKGGRKSAQHPNRPQLNREAAVKRWRKVIPPIKKV
jgi:general stress protein YciG